MSREIEIEKKNLLTVEEYRAIYEGFNLESETSFVQTNSYFDTKNNDIRKTDSALRIRTRDLFAEITLKTPCNSHLLEINEPLTREQADEFIDRGCFVPFGDIHGQLLKLGLPEQPSVHLLTKLTTKRVEKKMKKGLLVLDHSWYGDKEDYELEIEADSEKDAMELFTAVLERYSIPRRKTLNKIARALNN